MAILSIGELLGIGPDELSGLIPYSGLDYSGSTITGISGSAIGGAGGTDSATVSAIASAYAESAVSGKLDNSASSTWYPMTGNPSGFLTSVDLSNYATTDYVDSSVSGKADASSLSAYQTVDGMSAFQPSGDYALNSSLSAKVDQSAFDDCCSSVESAISSLTDSASALSADMSSLSSDVTSMSSDVSSLSSDVSSISGALSRKMDSSASSEFTPTSSMSSYVPFSDLEYSASSQFITAIGGSGLVSIYGKPVQSDWTNVDTTSYAYIKNKPGAKPVLAGPGIQITENANDITISTTTLNGIGEIKYVTALPVSPVNGVLYLIPQS